MQCAENYSSEMLLFWIDSEFWAIKKNLNFKKKKKKERIIIIFFNLIFLMKFIDKLNKMKKKKKKYPWKTGWGPP